MSHFALTYQVYGVALGVRGPSREVVDEFRRTQLPADWEPTPLAHVEHWFDLENDEDAGWRIRRQGEVIDRGPDLEWLLRMAGNHVHLCVGEFSTPQVFLHAAAVDVGGRAVLLPGRSYAGKSSLALALAQMPGVVLYSDDFAVLDGSTVSPYAIPLSLRQPQGPPRLIEAQRLGWRPGSPPLPVDLILLASYQSGEVWKPVKLSPGQAALQLLAHTLSAKRAPRRTFETVTQLAAAVPVYQGKRGETEEVLAWLTSL